MNPILFGGSVYFNFVQSTAVLRIGLIVWGLLYMNPILFGGSDL